MEHYSEVKKVAFEAPLLTEPEERRIQLLLDYAACYEKRGEPETWGATPSSISESLVEQMVLIHQFARRHVVPNHLKETHPSVQGYMERQSINRFINRCRANDKNYIRALSPNAFSEVDDNRPYRLKHIEELSKKGQASPAEILALQGINYIGAVELASLTHPYGANLEYLSDMRGTIEKAVRLFGGEVFDEPETHFSISDVINDAAFETIDPIEYDHLSSEEKLKNRADLGEVVGLLMTRKRTIGLLPDGTIIRERTSFVLTKESGVLTDDILDAFAETAQCEHWGREAIAQIEGLNFFIEGMLNKEEHAKVIPVASTAYAFNKERLLAIDQGIELYDSERTALLSGHAMHDTLRELAAEQLYRAGHNGLQHDAYQYEDYDGMAFFKKADTEKNSLPTEEEN